MVFTNALALNSVLTPAFAVSFIFIAHFLFLPKKLYSRPPFLFYFWLVYLFSYFGMATGSKATNHLFLWSFPFFVYYFIFKNELFANFSLQDIKKNVLGVITFTTIFSCAFAILEFISSNFLGLDLSFIPRGTVETYRPFDMGFFRARSFVEESGHFAFFVEIFGPLSVFWINRYVKRFTKYILYTIILFGFLTTLSGAGFGLLLLYLFLMVSGYYFRTGVKNNSSKIKMVFSLISLSILVLILFPHIIDFIGNVISAKFDVNNVSRAERESRLLALDRLSGLSFLIGYGPAAYDTLKVPSFISLYLGILMNTGIIGLTLFVLFELSKYNIVRRIKDFDLRIALKSSLVIAFIHLGFIDIIYVPWLWILLAIIDVVHKKERLLLLGKN